MTRNQLFSNLALGLSLAGGLVAATPAASAQTGTHMTATIPFAFSADKWPVAAGKYTVAVTTEHFLSFTNVETGKTQIVMVRPDDGQPNRGPSRLVFHREAGQIYLTQVWVAGKSLHSDLISHPKPQREFAKLAAPASTFEIAMR